LSVEQREALELVFQVGEGSSDFLAPIETFLAQIAAGITGMDDQHKTMVLIAVAVIIAVGTLGWKAIDSNRSKKEEEIKANLAASNEAEKTRQFEIIASMGSNNVVNRFEDAAERGNRAVVRGASDAVSVQVGRTFYDQDDIGEAARRAPRIASSVDVVEDDYRVFNSESKLADLTKYVLASDDGVEFPIVVTHGDFDEQSLNRLWEAARRRTKIRLEVAIVKGRNGIRSAQLLAVV